MNQFSIYNSSNLFQQNLFQLFRSMIIDFKKSKELIWRLFLRDFTSRHKQSLLGWLWIILMPAMTMGTFLLLNTSGIIQIGEVNLPYPIFGLLSFSIWNLFANGLVQTTTSITGAGGLIQKINFGKDALVFASFGQVLIDFVIRVALTVLAFAVYGRWPPATLLLLPIVLLPLILLTLGIGFLTSLMQAITKDTVSFVNLSTDFLLLLMPIMYLSTQQGILAKINTVNPLYFLVIVPRDIVLYGQFHHLIGFGIASLLAIILFLFGWLTFYLSQTKLAERV